MASPSKRGSGFCPSTGPARTRFRGYRTGPASEFLDRVERHSNLSSKIAARSAAIFFLRLECLSTRSRNSDALEALSVEIRAVFRRSRAEMRGSRPVGFRVESVFCASKNRKTENAQNEILDVRKFGQKVVKTCLLYTSPSPRDS